MSTDVETRSVESSSSAKLASRARYFFACNTRRKRLRGSVHFTSGVDRMAERIFQKNKRKKLGSSPGASVSPSLSAASQDNSSEASPVEKIIFGVSLWKDDCKEIEGSLSGLGDAVYATAENAEMNRTTFSNIGGGRFLVCAMERFNVVYRPKDAESLRMLHMRIQHFEHLQKNAVV